jgi:hypothetical protein
MPSAPVLFEKRHAIDLQNRLQGVGGNARRIGLTAGGHETESEWRKIRAAASVAWADGFGQERQALQEYVTMRLAGLDHIASAGETTDTEQAIVFHHGNKNDFRAGCAVLRSNAHGLTRPGTAGYASLQRFLPLFGIDPRRRSEPFGPGKA